MKIYVNHKSCLEQSCGITEIGHFRDSNATLWGPPSPTINALTRPAGAGWFLASFTDNVHHVNEYKEAYEQLKKKYKIVYQSPVRKNTRTGRNFFFCIYDITQKGN